MSEAPISTTPSTAPVTAADWLARAMTAHQRGQLDEAREFYRQTLALAPEHPDGLHLFGVLEGQFGSGDAAVDLITRAIAVNPMEPMFHNNLGNVLLQLDRLEEAEACYRQAVTLDPARYDAFNNLAILLGRQGHLEASEEVFKKLLEAAPGFTDARENLASLYLRQRRLNDALAQCAIGLVTSPRARGLRRLLALAYSVWDMPEQAAAVYRDWMKDEPDNPQPAHFLAALSQQDVPARASDAFVSQVFDDFAGSFDSKLAELGYRAPALVGEALRVRLSEGGDAIGPNLRVLDAGCGTGLCGEHLAPCTSTLVGVDLSRGMLEKAATRGLYQELVQGELVAFLQSRPAAFDVIVSADTMCYFGALEDFAAAALGALDGAGWLIFTVEAHDDADGALDYRLHAHGRYSHRPGYVQAVLSGAGFSAVQLASVVLRMEATVPVAGWLVCARLSEGPGEGGRRHG